MTDEQVKEKIQTDPYFIGIRRFGYDLKELEVRYPDGAPDHIIAAALKINKDEVEDLYIQIIEKMKKEIGVIN